MEVILPANMVGMAMGLLSRTEPQSETVLIKPVGLLPRHPPHGGVDAAYGARGKTDLSRSLRRTAIIDKDKDDRGERFIGRTRQDRTGRAWASNREGSRIARQGMFVLAGGTRVGTVTSGCIGPPRLDTRSRWRSSMSPRARRARRCKIDRARRHRGAGRQDALLQARYRVDVTPAPSVATRVPPLASPCPSMDARINR